MKPEKTNRKPLWLKTKLPNTKQYNQVKQVVELNHLHTICSSGKCPNIGQCWTNGTATFMISGNICTRACRFCATETGKPLPLDADEPLKIAQAVRLMNLSHCVITSVDRDDLPDKSASHWAETITQIRLLNPKTIVEVLTPDFDAQENLLQIVFNSKPDIFSHNIETVKSLTPQIRSRARYDLSLRVLELAKQAQLITKTSFMLGLGESKEEVIELIHDIKSVGCNLLAIGQYLQPTKQNTPVIRYVPPQEFDFYKEKALQIGFDQVESGPLVRSSYMAEKTFIESKLRP
jgi:lipoic acid synthetase